jgi:predicted nucleotidyltransferase
MRAYQREARAQEARRAASLSDRYHEARDAAMAAARQLKEQHGATKVLLFGSVASGIGFHERSDIDLAVEGISVQGFWRASSDAERAARPFEIDVIDLAAAPPSLRAHIEDTGVCL